MSFLDLFKSETKQRNIYGFAGNSGLKVMMLSYLLRRGTDVQVMHKLLGLYTKYNRGSQLIQYLGIVPGDAEDGTTNFLTETISRVIPISTLELSGIGTIEEQIAEYINNNNITKSGKDAEVWVELT